MPFASGNKIFFPALAIIGVLSLWKGGKRAWLCALMILLILWPGDSFICNTIKHAVGRPRPFVTLPDVRQPASGTLNSYVQATGMEQAQTDSLSVPPQTLSTTS